ncbi:fructokinase [Zoogloeaceae bacteirum Par-f-2]|uniref:ROK family protein n=1 Tax=Pseudothauera hydrothermalis TaxID=2184083 RepID=UPI000D25993E|nr:ROK family protein [Pseudothauera hydrothermalis]AVZ80473.1 fructokinase [Zoogloeaceae bacteirum Par-f-2]
MIRIGVDLGGSKIEVVALDDDGRELLRRRVPTPQGDYPATVAAVAALVEQAETELGVHGRCPVGIGTPGSISPLTGRMRNANSTCLNGQALREDLAARLKRPLRIANDADCFAMSEATDGAGAGAPVVFGVIIGTGVGGGVVVHGRLLTGANGIAGEWGHCPLPQPAPEDLPLPVCFCGRSGCIETYLSGPGMAADHLRHSGQLLDAATIAQRAAAGDAACEATLARYEQRLARALAGVINLLDPDVIVLGGGLSRIERLYRTVPQLWPAHVFSDRIVTRLLPARHGDASGVRGAARLYG